MSYLHLLRSLATPPPPPTFHTVIYCSVGMGMHAWVVYTATLIKNKKKFSSYIRQSVGSGAKSYMTNDLLIYGENICTFPQILGSPSASSYMTLHPTPSEFP
jgi:hypothetical protein